MHIKIEYPTQKQYTNGMWTNLGETIYELAVDHKDIILQKTLSNGHSEYKPETYYVILREGVNPLTNNTNRFIEIHKAQYRQLAEILAKLNFEEVEAHNVIAELKHKPEAKIEYKGGNGNSILELEVNED